MLVELRLDEPEREARGPDLGHVHLAQEIREGADVVLVPVREDDGADVVPPVAQVLEVGEDEVDAEMLVPREGQAGVDDDEPVVALDDRHVLADLAQAAERDDPCAPGHPRKCTSGLRPDALAGLDTVDLMREDGARAGLLGAIGKTPVVRLERLAGPGAGEVWLKLESANPTGSYKDRMALAMIEGAERSGGSRPARRSSSTRGGSTGSSLAFVCSLKGYPLRIVTSDAFAPEKLWTMAGVRRRARRHPQP